MQTDIVKKAGIDPKTLLSSVLYWKKLERNVSTVLFLPYLVMIIAVGLTQRAAPSTQIPTWEGWMMVLGSLGFIVGALYNLWATYLVPKIYAQRVRIFATKNHLDLLPQSKLVGLIPNSAHWTTVHEVQAMGCVLSVSGHQVTVFDYSCVVGLGRRKEYLSRGLAVLQLKGDYPHLFLDSKKNGKNHQYAANQKVDLEGNFSEYFDVYMPEGSGAGSLTVFAPDMMQTILDTGKLFDVEINGNQAVIISDEFAFTNRVLPAILNCAAGLSKEFAELDRTWQPIFSPDKRRFKLNGQSPWRVLLISLIPILLGLSFSFIPETIKHPIKNQTASTTSPGQGTTYNQDAATLAAAYEIAEGLNTYTARYPVPDSLTQAHITYIPASITYTKLLPDTYQFCATYNGYINGNGPTGASGNIVSYYGATVNSPNLPSTLQIVEWHDQGKNCQVIKPAPPARE